MIREIPQSAWSNLEGVFREEFNSDLPLPEHATFYGSYEGDKLRAFVLVENVAVIGQLASNGDMKAVRELVAFLQDKYDGRSVAAVASEERFEALYYSLGMEQIPGTLFRKN